MKYALCITSPEITKDFVFSMMCGSFEEKLSDMARFGYSGMELLCGYPQECDRAHVLGTCRKNNLGLSDVSSGAVATVTGLHLLETDRDRMKDAARVFSGMVDLAAGLGSRIVTIGAFRGWARDVGGTENAEEIFAELFGRLEPRLKDNDVHIALEPVNRGQTDIFNTCGQVLDFIGKACISNVGVLFDTYNAQVAEDDPFGALEKTLDAGKLLHFHIADTDRLVPGQGSIDFTSHLRILKKHGYDGFLSGELKSGDDPTATGRDVIENMRRFEECI